AGKTGTDGGFSVSLTDPADPKDTESGTLTADTAFTTEADLLVSFEPTPVVKKVEIDTPKNVFAGAAAPGKPVELDVKVYSEGPTDADNDDVVLKDYPVTFTVDKGFLTPDNAATGKNVAPKDLALVAGKNGKGDLFGFYENLGT